MMGIDTVPVKQMRVRDVEGATKGEIWFNDNPSMEDEVRLVKMKRAEPGEVVLVFKADLDRLTGDNLAIVEPAGETILRGVRAGLENLLSEVELALSPLMAPIDTLSDTAQTSFPLPERHGERITGINTTQGEDKPENSSGKANGEGEMPFVHDYPEVQYAESEGNRV
jgi:hypothetical protein